jgi:DNA-directed RNA polymerase specialized sigma24 family protein
MERDEVVKALRNMQAMRRKLELLEDALERLTDCEREIIDKMYIRPVAKASDIICEKFDIEVAAVYRRRNKALKKLAVSLA